MVQFTIKDLLENGVHYGHNTRRWNPKMSKYIYGTYNGIHVIDLQKTAPLLHASLDTMKKVVASGGKILFVGTKKQSSLLVKDYVEKCGQYYVNHRWLGGMLTNWKTISKSISKLDKLDKQIEEGMQGLTKKEKLQLAKEREKLNLVLGGIRKMGGVPDLIVVFDTIKEAIAVEEANKLNIPVVGIVDTNSNPDPINFPIPGNDDALKSIRMFADVFSQSVLEGLKEAVASNVKATDKTEKTDSLDLTIEAPVENNLVEADK
jgi:small subunit ribosomal protein S2